MSACAAGAAAAQLQRINGQLLLLVAVQRAAKIDAEQNFSGIDQPRVCLPHKKLREYLRPLRDGGMLHAQAERKVGVQLLRRSAVLRDAERRRADAAGDQYASGAAFRPAQKRGGRREHDALHIRAAIRDNDLGRFLLPSGLM